MSAKPQKILILKETKPLHDREVLLKIELVSLNGEIGNTYKNYWKKALTAAGKDDLGIAYIQVFRFFAESKHDDYDDYLSHFTYFNFLSKNFTKACDDFTIDQLNAVCNALKFDSVQTLFVMNTSFAIQAYNKGCVDTFKHYAIYKDKVPNVLPKHDHPLQQDAYINVWAECMSNFDRSSHRMISSRNRLQKVSGLGSILSSPNSESSSYDVQTEEKDTTPS